MQPARRMPDKPGCPAHALAAAAGEATRLAVPPAQLGCAGSSHTPHLVHMSDPAMRCAGLASPQLPVLATLPSPLCLLGSLGVQEAPFHCHWQAPATATIAFNAAATNAISAASNVTATINNTVMQLQSQVCSVHSAPARLLPTWFDAAAAPGCTCHARCLALRARLSVQRAHACWRDSSTAPTVACCRALRPDVAGQSCMVRGPSRALLAQVDAVRSLLQEAAGVAQDEQIDLTQVAALAAAADGALHLGAACMHDSELLPAVSTPAAVVCRHPTYVSCGGRCAAAPRPPPEACPPRSVRHR